ncbi:hypothetical protein C8Q74DRAFT_1363320 [Fomes fomentarius]|nr:hypothetical protein C8Q74DRAFT_1363320 [Fomes fomentarius]
METLPTELLLQIFTIACTDSGHTGCSLSSVSKHIRNVSHPVRFHCIALNGSPTQLVRFLALLDVLQTPAPPPVRHLCYATPTGMHYHTEMEALEIDMLVEESYMTVMEGGRWSGWYDNEEDAVERQYADLVAKLLRTVAPTLKSLAMAFLNVRVERFLTSAAAMVDCEPFYPSLRRVYLILTDIRIEFVKWARHTPALTDIRITHLPYGRDDGLLKLVNTVQHGPAELLPRLKRVLIQPGRLSPGIITFVIEYLDLLVQLWRSQVDARVPVYLLPPAPPISMTMLPEQYVRGFNPENLQVEDGGEVREEWAHLDQDGCLPPQYLMPWMHSELRENISAIWVQHVNDKLPIAHERIGALLGMIQVRMFQIQPL